MSYARMGADGSDVYVVDVVNGYLSCWWCALRSDNWHTTDLEAMVAHLAEHRAAGHHVPNYVEVELRADFPNGYDPATGDTPNG